MALLFWISFAGMLYTYAVYPAIIWLFSRLAGRDVLRRSITPRISVIVPCHNTETNIISRIKNLEASDYPSDKLEIIVVSDGSTDGTEGAMMQVSAQATLADGHSCTSDAKRQCQITVLGNRKRRGKAAALNYAIAVATGDIIVFADPRQRFERRAIRE